MSKNCTDFRIFIENESDGSGKTTLEKRGRNPPNVSLLRRIMDLLSFLSQFLSLNRVESQSEEKYNIEKEPGLCDSSDQMEAGKWNASWEADDDHWLTDDQTCGTQQSITGDTEDSDAELMMMRPQGSHKNKKSKIKQKKVAAKVDVHKSNQTESVSSPPQSLPSNYNESNMCKSQKYKTTVYIRIPFSCMPSKMPSKEVLNVSSRYKLINELPPDSKVLTSDSDVRTRKSYIMSYNPKTKNAHWVYEILNKMTLESNWKKDMSLGKNEFTNELYDQGHLAAAANHTWSQEAYNHTFLFSNMTPQLSLLNKGMWCKLEQHCRDLVKRDGVCNVHVYTGPLYLKKEKGSKKYVRVPEPENEKDFGGKALPTHFFKVVIVENEDGKILEPECYQMPNNKKQYENQLKKNEEEEEEKEEEKEAGKEKAAAEKEEEAEKAEIEKLPIFLTNIDDIEYRSGLRFISRCNPNMKEKKMSVKLMGDKSDGEMGDVDIEVRIIPTKK